MDSPADLKLRHAAVLLARSLTDEMLHTIRVEWGTTNASVLEHWRAEILASPVAVEPQQQEVVKQPNPCPVCGTYLWNDPRPCWNCARLSALAPARAQEAKQ